VATSDLSSKLHSPFGTSGANARQDHVFSREGCERFLLASEYATTFATFDMLATSCYPLHMSMGKLLGLFNCGKAVA
jgi:hypothetical protein